VDLPLEPLLRWIILLPVIGAILNGVFLRSKNGILSGLLGTAAAVGAFIVTLVVIGRVPDSHGTVLALDPWFTWMKTGDLEVAFQLEVTPLTRVMLLVVTGIGSLIHLYATGYMSHDKSPWRFFAYLNLFLAAMLSLILSSNLVGVFLGWEGVGLCSYLLIGFWFEKDENAAAGMKAFVTNRVGDLGFVLALMVIFAYTRTFEMSKLVEIAQAGQIPAWVWLTAAAGIFWASTGKSAQIPLYVWLPDAMAGPTPVSALIHAATMVTSGVFLITRVWPIFAGQPAVLDVVLWGGLATAWIAALTALTQRDIKKVLAYSTVSQLGFMFVALGCGSPAAALFHVVTHACFKALLFLGAGSVIHGMHEKQDLFEMGGLRHHMKWTHLTFLAGVLAIIGFPLTSGFFSKDMIIAKAMIRGAVPGMLLIGAALVTSFYMVRAYTLAFWGEARSKEAAHAHESSPIMLAPLVVLAVLSIFVGWFETPEVFHGPTKFSNWVLQSWYGVSPAGHEGHLSHAMEWILMGVVSALSLGVAWYSFTKYRVFRHGGSKATALHRVSENKFYVDEIYAFLILRPLKFATGKVTKFVDVYVINGFLHALRDGARISGQVLSLFHTGSVQVYGWYLAVGTVLVLLFVRWWAV